LGSIFFVFFLKLIWKIQKLLAYLLQQKKKDEI
jgi:hypothetical protein